MNVAEKKRYKSLKGKTDKELISLSAELTPESRTDLLKKYPHLYDLMRDKGLLFAVKSPYRSIEEFVAEMKRKYGQNATRSQFDNKDRRSLHKKAKTAPIILKIFPVKPELTKDEVWERSQSKYPGLSFHTISRKNGRMARLLLKHGLDKRLKKDT